MHGLSRGRTLLNEDFREMLSALSDEAADYLLVSAYALAAHGLPRATGDMGLWVRCSAGNAERAWGALAKFGAPISGGDHARGSRDARHGDPDRSGDGRRGVPQDLADLAALDRLGEE